VRAVQPTVTKGAIVQTGANGDPVCRLMRALATLGVLATEDRHRFLTDMEAPLLSGTPGSLRSMLLTRHSAPGIFQPVTEFQL
jgi:hypothetical protein